MGAWEDGFAAGYERGLYQGSMGLKPTIEQAARGRRVPAKTRKPKRRASPAQKRYGREFKRLAPKYKKKSGGWKKDGFKRCAAAARKAAKK